MAELQDQQLELPTEEDILEGGPEAETAPESPQDAPQLVSIRVNGKTLTVPPDVADAILEREDAFQRKLSEQGAELGRLRKQDPPQTPTKPDPADEDLEFYQSPSQAFAKREAALRQAIKEEIAQEYRLEQARAAWWGTFWSENPTLVGKERLVGAVLQQEFDAVKDLPPERARKALADAVNQTIHGAAQASKPSTKTPLPTRPARTERASGPSTTPAPQTKQEPQTYSVTDIIKKRRAARRAAAANS